MGGGRGFRHTDLHRTERNPAAPASEIPEADLGFPLLGALSDETRLAQLVEDPEGRRRRVEDETASDFCSAAASFETGWLPPETLGLCADLEWIASRLR